MFRFPEQKESLCIRGDTIGQARDVEVRAFDDNDGWSVVEVRLCLYGDAQPLAAPAKEKLVTPCRPHRLFAVSGGHLPPFRCWRIPFYINLELA